MQTRKKKSNNKIKIFLLLILFVVVISGSLFFLNKKNLVSQKSSVSVESKQPKKTSKKTGNNEGKLTRQAMTDLSGLYSDVSTKKLKKNITTADIEKTRKSINKLEDGKMKKDLLTQLEIITQEVMK